MSVGLYRQVIWQEVCHFTRVLPRIAREKASSIFACYVRISLSLTEHSHFCHLVVAASGRCWKFSRANISSRVAQTRYQLNRCDPVNVGLLLGKGSKQRMGSMILVFFFLNQVLFFAFFKCVASVPGTNTIVEFFVPASRNGQPLAPDTARSCVAALMQSRRLRIRPNLIGAQREPLF
jgi:hypothetical protein